MMKKIRKKIKNIFRPASADSRIQWSLYGRVWREIGKPQWKLLLAGIICTLIAAAAEAFSITLVKKIIDQGFIEQNMRSLYFIGAQIIGAFGFKSIFTYSKTLFMARAGLQTSTNLRKRIFRHMTRMHIASFQDSATGRILNYYGIQAGAVLELVTGTIISSVQNSATVLMMLGLMIYYAPQMVGVLLFMAPAIAIPMIVIMRKKNKLTRKSFGISNQSSGKLSQTIQGIKTIQSFGNEQREYNEFEKVENDNLRVQYKSMKLSGLQSPLLEMVISFGLAIALVIGGHFITSGAISTGDFVAFILALTAMYTPAKRIVGINGGIQRGLIAAEQLFDYLDEKSAVADAPDAKILRAKKMHVEFENVSFAYNASDGDVLKDISLDVPAGTVCAFVGPSGGGKSTIFNLLERFYDPNAGRVKINGRDIREYSLKSLRENIAEVSQDVFLFGGTIADNIKYGAPNASRAAVIAAARAANADEFISAMPSGYDSPVGERGTMLSGGQKQRIAIARAILKDSPILLLDEATSALDTNSERLIQAALKKLMRGRTTFVIAHRLSTITDADQICVIREGRITERGTDKTLSKKPNGDYAKLRASQFKSGKK
ncbi:MAG: ABC transporter ATP-binding protein/permease [Rickettsiales bacterium]|jgi:subfamily B ATP-binding cassette protein MsbA|nr:ABC transporter ATP-binding protein/permease [Rickettsiales bacterium]